MVITGVSLQMHSFITSTTFLLLALLLQTPWSASIISPSSNCYVVDNSSFFHDFTDWIGHPFEFEGKDSDFVVRFCKDVESRSQSGYIDFGHYSSASYFRAGSGHVSFIQEFYGGDLMNCEHSFDKMGRTAQVNITCGSCLNGACKGELGCICNVTYDAAKCRVLIDLAIPCENRGLRVFEGFTVGFHPRSCEIIYNGMTQVGYEKARHEFSFLTEQRHVYLYMTAISSLSHLLGKPDVKVNPAEGLEVKLSGISADERSPTTLSPTMINLDWRCKTAHNNPYEVVISIPVDGYDTIEFVLTKLCEYRQDARDEPTRGWVVFGVLSCMFLVVSTLFCCGGFIYKTRVQHQHGVDALPGMTFLSACLETMSGGGRHYSHVDNISENFVNEASWERPHDASLGEQRTAERRYGSI